MRRQRAAASEGNQIATRTKTESRRAQNRAQGSQGREIVAYPVTRTVPTGIVDFFVMSDGREFAVRTGRIDARSGGV